MSNSLVLPKGFLLQCRQAVYTHTHTHTPSKRVSLPHTYAHTHSCALVGVLVSATVQQQRQRRRQRQHSLWTFSSHLLNGLMRFFVCQSQHLGKAPRQRWTLGRASQMRRRRGSLGFLSYFPSLFFLFSFLGKHILCAKVQNAKAKTVFRLQVYETGNGF